MANDSSTAGFLTPNTTPSPLEDQALDDFFQIIIVALSELDGSLVRPRWQPQAPNLPANTVNWAAIGVSLSKSDINAFEGHDPTGDGKDYMQRHEELDLFCSFYGPEAKGFASKVRDGLSIEQNRSYLTAAGMGLISVGDIKTAPELINNIWYYRVDVTIGIRRDVTRTYNILNLLSANGVIHTDIPPLTIPIEVNNN